MWSTRPTGGRRQGRVMIDYLVNAFAGELLEPAHRLTALPPFSR